MDFEEFCLCHFRVDLVTKDTLLAVSTDELLPVVVIEMVDRVDVCMRCSACRGLDGEYVGRCVVFTVFCLSCLEFG